METTGSTSRALSGARKRRSGDVLDVQIPLPSGAHLVGGAVHAAPVGAQPVLRGGLRLAAGKDAMGEWREECTMVTQSTTAWSFATHRCEGGHSL